MTQNDDIAALAQKFHQFRGEGRLAEALDVALELNQLLPADNDIRLAAGSLSLALGKLPDALALFDEGFKRSPQDLYFRTNVLKALYLSGFNQYDSTVKTWLGEFLKDPQSINISLVSRLWLGIFLHDPVNGVLLEGADFGDFAAFRSWFVAHPSVSDVLCSEFFLDGVRNCVIPDVRVERLLVHLRRWLLETVADGAEKESWHLPLAAAIAEQAFINEYVFAEDEQERKNVEALIASGKTDPLTVAVIAAYRPLFKQPDLVKALLGRNFDVEGLQNLIRRQIAEPAQEERIKKKIRRFGRISDDVSRKVRAQYEENPYPRWVSYGRVPDTDDNMVFDDRDRIKALDILIGGCATGHFPIRVAMNYPYSWISGIDLSLASLAYGARKAEEMELENVEFFNADILDARKLKKSFDIIFSTGVLHHMRDPEEGWRTLVDVLKPGGLMKIGLYPEHERRHITDGRAFIAANGIPDTVDGIRRMRQIIIDLPSDHPLKKIMPFNDFFSTSMMRDLLFHVQEQTFTIPRIKKDLEDFGLEFLGFPLVSAQERALYLQMFPDDPSLLNLDHWDAFERQYPDTFTGLYQFWCRKAA